MRTIETILDCHKMATERRKAKKPIVKITSLMILSDLAQHMGDATIEQARIMRNLLIEEGYQDTEEVPDNVWMQFLEDVVKSVNWMNDNLPSN